MYELMGKIWSYSSAVYICDLKCADAMVTVAINVFPISNSWGWINYQFPKIIRIFESKIVSSHKYFRLMCAHQIGSFRFGSSRMQDKYTQCKWVRYLLALLSRQSTEYGLYRVCVEIRNDNQWDSFSFGTFQLCRANEVLRLIRSHNNISFKFPL